MLNDLNELIEKLKKLSWVDTIVEYGSNRLNSFSPFGDYDIAIISNKKVFNTLSGIHFHVNGIPVDCMLKSYEDLSSIDKINKFDTVFSDCNILYDRHGIAIKMLEEVNDKISVVNFFSSLDVNIFRFRFSHVINKLSGRIELDEYKLFCNHTLSNAIFQCIVFYSKINNLQLAKYRKHFEYMKINDLDLYNLFEEFYDANNLKSKFDIIKKIFDLLLKQVGGIWKEKEIIYHAIGNVVSENDKALIAEMLDESYF